MAGSTDTDAFGLPLNKLLASIPARNIVTMFSSECGYGDINSLSNLAYLSPRRLIDINAVAIGSAGVGFRFTRRSNAIKTGLHATRLYPANETVELT